MKINSNGTDTNMRAHKGMPMSSFVVAAVATSSEGVYLKIHQVSPVKPFC